MKQGKHLIYLTVTLICALAVSCATVQGPVRTSDYKSTIKVACVGDSITYGSGIKNKQKDSYPAQLQKMLGDGWEVRNYGIGSRIMLKKGDHPYWNDAYFKEVQQWEPDVVIISLGTNDSKPKNWDHEAYRRDCRAMVDVFESLESKPIVRLCYPTPAYGDKWGISNTVIVKEIIPILDEVAKEKNIEVINNYKALSNKEELFVDKIHPNAEGAGFIAGSIYRSLTGHRPPLRGSKSQWKGYSRYDFKYDSRNCIIVSPKRAANDRPWVWRARFFGHEPQTDLALLKKGYHVAYIDVANLFGGPAAMKHWDGFYKFLTQEYDFSTKPVLEGMSRGGLIVLNWAKRNPQKVGCIYVDAPVCDIRSWPGKISDREVWKKCLKAYGLSEEQVQSFDDNPIDNLEGLAKAKVAILSVCGDADKVVPLEENTRVLEKRYKALGGKIKVIVKPGVAHHPHSIKDPSPIVDFILANTKK